MTCIAFDGRTLAADKQTTSAGMKRTVTKIFRIGKLVCGCSGAIDQGLEMLDWVRTGRDPERFPASQRTDNWSNLVVIEDGRVLSYEQTPYPIINEDPVVAFGSGRDYALAAMYLGCDARRAVAVACQFEAGCGMGIDAIDIDAAEADDAQ